nr:hypothetical protein [Phytohabitans flavus]
MLGLLFQLAEPGSHVGVIVVEGALLERGQVPVDRRSRLPQFPGDRRELGAQLVGGGGVLRLEFGDCFGDDIAVAGRVEVQQRGADRCFDLVGVEAVDVAACFGAVAGAAPAGVVPVDPVPAVRGGTHISASALGAADEPGEHVCGRVCGPVADLGRPLAQDTFREVELLGGDDRLVGVLDDDVAEAFLTEVDPVGQDQLDGVL